MISKAKEIFKEHRTLILRILLACLIAAQLGNIIYCFVYKRGIHSDESFSYAIANNTEGNLYFTYSDEVSRNSWVSGDIIDDYIVVDSEHRFDYAQVYRNNSTDQHPPLYYFVLHTVCSLFPGTFSWWYGFSINIVLFIITQIFLYKSAKKITKSELLSFLTVLLYGFCQGGINTFIFIRMYAMSTCLAVISTYLHLKLLEGKSNVRNNLIQIAIITWIGGQVHYYFLAFEFILSACMCIYYLFGRKLKKFFAYAATQLLSALLAIMIYPSIYTRLEELSNGFSKVDTYNGFWFESRYYKFYLFNELFGVTVLPRPSYFFIYLAEFMLYAFIVIFPIAVLFRKEKWVKRLLAFLGDFAKRVLHGLKNIHIYVYFTIIISTFVFAIICKTTTIFAYTRKSTRYMFLVYPAIYMSLIIVVNEVINFICSYMHNSKAIYYIKRTFICVFTAALLVFIMVRSEKSFYESYKRDTYISSLDRDANYIFAEYKDYLICQVLPELFGIDNLFWTSPNDVFDYADEIKSLDSDDKTYFIVNPPSFYYAMDTQGEDTFNLLNASEGVDINDYSEYFDKYINDFEEFFSENGIADKLEYIGLDVIYGAVYYIYEMK